jgi:phosphoglycolate phosphatase
MKPILLFDIDGTLLSVKRDFLLAVIETILDELNLPSKKTLNSSFAGRTDRDIFEELSRRAGGAAEHYELLKNLYVEEMLSGLSSDHIELIPGAEESVQFAVENNLVAGLCTGNFREVAFKKVEAAGMKDLFPFGGFGCNHADRIHLPREAHADYQRVFSGSAKPSDFVVIGDTPNDVRCAKHFGARSVAVTTGGFTAKELSESGPDLILENLSNPGAWIDTI